MFRNPDDALAYLYQCAADLCATLPPSARQATAAVADSAFARVRETLTSRPTEPGAAAAGDDAARERNTTGT